MAGSTATGRCLCGAVSYELHGGLRDVIVCHCVECRRWHGTSGAYTTVAGEGLVVSDPQDLLRWFPSPQSVTDADRGFCERCGSSLFWRAPRDETVSVTAGTLDGPTGLRTVEHIWESQRADWEADDGLPRIPYGT
jgi:hypothetical protein